MASLVLTFQLLFLIWYENSSWRRVLFLVVEEEGELESAIFSGPEWDTAQYSLS